MNLGPDWGKVRELFDAVVFLPPVERHRYLWGAVAFHPSGQLVATAGWDGKVRLWKVPSGVPDGEPLLHEKKATTVAFAPDRDLILTGCADGCVRFWDLATRQPAARKLQHPDGVTSLSTDPAGDLILTGCADGTAYLWNARDYLRIGGPLRHADGEAGVATAIARDKRLLTGSEDFTARLWNTNGEPIGKPWRHQNNVRGVNFSRDGTRAVTASDDRTARIWDVATGNLRTTLRHRSDLNAAAFTPDGNRLLTGSRDEGCQMWDIALQRRVGPRCRHQAEVMHLAMNGDGTMAVLADWDGYGLLWALPQPDPRDPQRIAEWVQAAVGMKLDEGGSPLPQVLDGPSWVELQKRVRQAGDSP